jgi:hypothetical protein
LNEDKVIVYNSEDVSVPATPKTLSGLIVSVENLDRDHVRLLTDSDKHAVLNLDDVSSEPRYLPGGPPILSEFVDSTGDYIYITENVQ